MIYVLQPSLLSSSPLFSPPLLPSSSPTFAFASVSSSLSCTLCSVRRDSAARRDIDDVALNGRDLKESKLKFSSVWR